MTILGKKQMSEEDIKLNYITGAKDALRIVRKQRISKCKKTFAFINKKFANRMEIFINMCYNIIICHKIRRVSQYAHQLQ